MIIELGLSIVVIVFIVAFVQKVKKSKNGDNCILCITMLYLISVLYFTTIRGGRSGLGGICIRFPFPFYNALKTHRYGKTANRSVLNLLLFVPLGYLLPQFFSKPKNHSDASTGKIIKKWWQVISIGFITSLLIETGQIVFRVGIFELDDILKNTMGTGVGFLIFIVSRYFER